MVLFIGFETLTEEDETLIYTHDGRKYTLQNLPRTLSSRMKVHIRFDHGGRSFIDRFDLYASRARQSFINRVSTLLETDPRAIEEDLILIIGKLEEKQGYTAIFETEMDMEAVKKLAASLFPENSIEFISWD